MSTVATRRKLTENQVYFRQPNQKVVKELNDLSKVAEEEGYKELVLSYKKQF